MKTPIFSIILPAHRYDDYLKTAIKSVTNQCFNDFEIIVVLNGQSIGHLKDLREEFFDPRIKFIQSVLPNLVFALNLGINNAAAEYIVRMDSDDVCKENRLKILWETISANPEVDVIGSSFDIINSNGDFVRRSTLIEMESSKIRKLLPLRCVIPHPTVVLKKSTAIKVGGYGYGQFSEDYDLWLRILRSPKSKFMIIDEPLIDYRVHASQATSVKNDLSIMAYDLSLKFRELIITRNIMYIPGIWLTIFDFFYKKLHRIVRI